MLAFFISVLIIFNALDFLQPDFLKGFLRGKSKIFYSGYNVALYVHMFSAPISILVGVFQFGSKKGQVHKVLGKVYILSVLFLAAPSGLILSFFAIGGLWSTAAFSILSCLWFWFTIKSFWFIKRGNYLQHERFMIRSFILANSAIILRLLIFVNTELFNFDKVIAYVVIAWLSWLPFLLMYELTIRLKNQKVG